MAVAKVGGPFKWVTNGSRPDGERSNQGCPFKWVTDGSRPDGERRIQKGPFQWVRSPFTWVTGDSISRGKQVGAPGSIVPARTPRIRVVVEIPAFKISKRLMTLHPFGEFYKAVVYGEQKPPASVLPWRLSVRKIIWLIWNCRIALFLPVKEKPLKPPAPASPWRSRVREIMWRIWNSHIGLILKDPRK